MDLKKLSLALSAPFLFWIGCDADQSTQEDAAAIEAGCITYAQNCAGCHGPKLLGDGPHAQHLVPRATNLVSPESSGKSDEHRFERIMKGGDLPPYNSGMPAYESLLTETDVRNVIGFVDSVAAGATHECKGSVASSVGGGGAGGNGGGGGGIGGNGPGGSGSTGGSGGAPAHCVAWCGCLSTYCAPFPGYPFADQDACLASCIQTDESLISCWQDFCNDVENNPGLADHQCEHAWGGLGDFECGE